MLNTEVSIVGAGLAGSLLAIYLTQRGLGVNLYESRSDMRLVDLDAGRSINLALANRGIRALDKVGLGDQVRQLLTPMRGRMLHDHGDLQFQSYGQQESEVIYSVSRPGLNKLLMNQAEYEGAEIHFDQRCVDIDVATPALHFEHQKTGDTQKVTQQPVIATDGSGSIVRRRMQEQGLTHSVEDYLAHGYKELCIPPGLDGDYQMEPNALHVWPRGSFMLIALPNLDASFTVTLFMPKEGEISFASLNNKDTVMEFFSSTFPDVLPMIPELSSDFFDNPTGSMVTVRCEPWRTGSGVLLLGDAAHAIVPFHGQGMNCAFEDCYQLDTCIDDGNSDWSSIFSAFEASRKPNSNAIADLALENYVEMRDTVRDPSFHLKKALAWELEKLYPNIFIPRYSMVMFHHIPYSEAQRRGEVQKHILNELGRGISKMEEMDYDRAAELIENDLLPLVSRSEETRS